MKRLALTAALLLATASSLSWAQSPADHEKHHPDQKETPAAKQPASPKGQSGMSGSGMGGASGMQGMMGGRMPMMDMMQMMGMMRQSDDGMGGMATIDHVEGRIAFLRTELNITDAQNGVWNAFADALRANAKSLSEVRSSMVAGMAGPSQQSMVDRLALQEKWLAARLEGTRAIKSALTNLVATLSDDQKKTADELLAPHMGMMAMMRSRQMMGSGQMGLSPMQPPGR